MPLILMLSAAHPPEDVRIVAKQGAALAAAGFRVRHLAPGLPEHAAMAGVELRSHGPAPRGWRARIAAIPRLARAAIAARPAVIHAHEPDAWLAGLIAARRCGARLVLDVHEHYPSRMDGRLPALLRPVARLALTMACAVLGRLADAVVVAKDGLDGPFGGEARCTKVRNYAVPVPAMARRHGPGPITLLHLGALTSARGAFTMLEALALLPTDTQLVQIGRFTDGSEAAFHARVAALGLRSRVTVLPWMEREAALRVASLCDVGLVLFQPGVENHRLALPHKLFDGMLVGLPMVVPDFAPEVRGVVQAAGCGIAVDTADPRAVAAAVRRLTDAELRGRMGAAGRAAALGRFAWAAEAARLVALYRGLLPAPSRQ
jgi:glycosyltransferase involved in cell wall biosynthesis